MHYTKLHNRLTAETVKKLVISTILNLHEEPSTSIEYFPSSVESIHIVSDKN